MKRLCLIISVLIFGITALSFGQVSNKWKASITITSDSKSCTAYFGTHPAATDGFDTSLGDYNDIPLPPGFNEALRAIFVIEGLDLYQDIRPIGTWTLSVTSQKPFSLSWNISEVPENISLSLNLNGTVIDMRQQSSIEGLPSGTHTYTISGAVESSKPTKLVPEEPLERTLQVGATASLVVQVLDQFNYPMAGVQVTFTVVEGDGKVNDQNSVEVGSGNDGKASVTFKAGTVASVENKVKASVEGIEERATFTITTLPGPAETIEVEASPNILAPDGQSTSTVTVTVKDIFGNPVPDEKVTMGITQGSGNIGSVTNNNDGTYTATYTAGTEPGDVIITATTSNGKQGSVTITLIELGKPAEVVVTVDPAEVVVVDGRSTVTITVKDAKGEGVPGKDVTLTVSEGNGSMGSVEDKGDGTYVAEYTAGTKAGVVTITAAVEGISSSATVTLRPGPVHKVEVVVSPSTLVADGQSTAQMTITVEDEYDNSIPGKEIAFSISEGNGSMGSVEDKGDGTYVAEYTAGTKAGVVTITAAVEGISGSATVTLAPGPAEVVEVVALPSTLAANGQSTSRITATVKDAHGNLIPTETITMRVTQGGGSVGSVTNNGDGTYSAVYTAGTVVETVTITATTSNGKTGSVTLTLISPNNPPYITSVGGKPPWESHAVEAGSQLTLVVEAVDPDNDPITYSATNLPAGSSFNSSTHTFTWTPTDEQVGTYTVRFIVSDGELVDELPITINVTSRLSLSITSPLDGAVIKGLSVDVSGSVVGATSVVINGEAATISDGTFSGTAAFTDYGDQTVQVVATAADGRATSATVSVKLVERLIKSVTVAGSPAKAGGKITVTAETETSGTATFSIEGVPGAIDISMAETAPNTYTGEYTVSAGEDVTDATVTVSFTNALGQTETDTSQKVTIDTQAVVTLVSVEGSPAKAGDKIRVTVVAEPNGTATFSIEGIPGATDVSMTETNGMYKGEYVVRSGDNVKDAAVTVSFIDALGNSASMTADQKVTIDTTPPTISSVQTDKESVRNGESFTLTVKTEPSVSVSVDVSDLDTTKTEPIQLQEIQDGIYEVEMTVSEQNKADEGIKTLVITAADSLGNTSTAQVTVELKLTSEFTLQLRKGLNLLSVPVKPSDTFTLADLMGMMGDGVRFIIRFDPDKRKFVSYLPGDPKAAEVPVRGCDGYLTALDEPVTLKIEGEAWDGEVKLVQGINMIAVPLMPPEPITIADMIAKFGENVVTLVVYLDTETGKFKSVTPQTASEVTVQGGAGYIVIAQTEATATFEGKAWANTSPPSPAAPIFSSSNLIGNSPLLVVEGTLTGDVTDDGIGIRVENLSGGVVSSSETENGRFTAILMGLNEAYSVGDVIKITAEVPKGYMAEPIFHRITFEEIESGVVSVKLTLRRIPDQTMLLPNYPNPFNPETWIPFQLAQGTEVTIRIYDLKGRLVRKLNLGYKPAGIYADRQHAAYWDGRNELGERVASGIYIYRMKAGDKTFTRRMTIIK